MKKTILKRIRNFNPLFDNLEVIKNSILIYQQQKGFANAATLWMKFNKVEREVAIYE